MARAFRPADHAAIGPRCERRVPALARRRQQPFRAPRQPSTPRSRRGGSAGATSDGWVTVRRVPAERGSFRQEQRSASAGKRAEIATSSSLIFRFRPDSSDRSLARRPLCGFEWPRPRRPTHRGVPRRPRSTRSCANTSRRSARRPRVCATEKACPASSSRSSGTFCGVARSPAASRDLAVMIVLDRLVPFSCKARPTCPSCGGRRMAERAAHLLDHVFPDVPVRQSGAPGAAAALGGGGC